MNGHKYAGITVGGYYQSLYGVLYEMSTWVDGKDAFGPYQSEDFELSVDIFEQHDVSELLDRAPEGDNGENRCALMLTVMACNEYANALSLMVLQSMDDETFRIVAQEMLSSKATTERVINYVTSVLRADNPMSQKHRDAFEKRLVNLTIFFESSQVFESVGLKGEVLRNLIDYRVKKGLAQIVRSAMKGVI